MTSRVGASMGVLREVGPDALRQNAQKVVPSDLCPRLGNERIEEDVVFLDLGGQVLEAAHLVLCDHETVRKLLHQLDPGRGWLPIRSNVIVEDHPGQIDPQTLIGG